MKLFFHTFFSGPIAIASNLLLIFAFYLVCRIEFLLENWDIFRSDLTMDSTRDIFIGGFLFDASAIAYTNAFYLLLVLFPLHWKERPDFSKYVKWLFVSVNSLAVVVNLMDSVYFPFNKQRTTSMFYEQFQNEDNLLTIFGVELLRHWYLALLAVVLVLLLVKFYRPIPVLGKCKPLWNYYLSQTLSLIVLGVLTVFGMRGNVFVTFSRPISINDAFKYSATPIQSGLVLNTPFAILRTLSEKPMPIPEYYPDQVELDSLFSPVHFPLEDRVRRNKNVCILIVESFAQEFVGALNHHLDGGSYQGYTPFVDSLLAQSLSWRETFCNSGTSIDAMPAVLASIPKMGRPFVLTPFSLNNINTLATELRNLGYQSAFFHGAPNGSMGFQAFARSAGYDRYVGMTEYSEDKRFGGKQEFDGTWGIWDEPFLQFFSMQMSKMKEPFLTTVFTLSSHHPFNLPEEYRDTFPNEGRYPIHKCIRYADHSLRQFFKTASQQPWYKNTIFVLCADHASSRITHEEYMTEVGLFRIPILFYDPSGEMPRGMLEGLAQQIDIMPTILAYLGYDRPYIAFGKDLLHTNPNDTWAMNWDHLPQYIQGDYTLLFNGKQTTGFYNYRRDRFMKNDLRGTRREQVVMERRLKAFLQSYVQRMKANNVTMRQQTSTTTPK